MGVHSGVAETRASDYYGPTVNRAARIMGAGHGGQVLLSSAAAALVVDTLPDGATLRDLGEHRLKNLGRPERVSCSSIRPSGATFHRWRRRAGTTASRPDLWLRRSSGGAEGDRAAPRPRGACSRWWVRGGTGKTRLALKAAADHADRFEEGVFFVDLSPVREIESVLTAIADYVGSREPAGQPLLAELTRNLHEQRALVILDNFEQVIPARDRGR